MRLLQIGGHAGRAKREMGGSTGSAAEMAPGGSVEGRLAYRGERRGTCDVAPHS
jgi:hypothetical protein